MVEQRERRSAEDTQPSEARTLSGEPLEPLYGPADLAGFDPEAKLGRPGAYPFTRGVYPSMYRGRLCVLCGSSFALLDHPPPSGAPICSRAPA